jgi:hypothetical protein
MSIDAVLPLPDYCWPVDEGCCDAFADYDPSVQERAKALATQTLRALTAYRVGGCPITVRPCKRGCVGASSSWLYSGGTFFPTLWAGVWTNSCGCANPDCSCGPLEELVLPAPVGRVDSVLVDGVTLPATSYRVDNGDRLVRLDGGLWPACQDMDKAPTEVGTMAVTYLNSYPVDGLGAYAAGVLACEYAKACSGKKCSLPAGVTDITRRGISMTITTGAFPGGVTGIREVDSYLMRWNPNHLTMAPRVWSPDMPRVRVTTKPPPMISAVTRQDIRFRQGDDVSKTVTVRNADGTLADLTGYTALAQIRRDVADVDTTVDATFACTISGSEVIMYLGDDQTTTLTGDYVWDLEVTSPTGITTTIMTGQAIADAEVSRYA